MPSGRPKSLSVCCLVHDHPSALPVCCRHSGWSQTSSSWSSTAHRRRRSPLLGALADSFYRVPVQLPFEQYLPWLHSLCSGDWIFRIDGDEAVSASLLEQLPSLVLDDRVLQYRLPRRWLFPDVGHYLSAAPWCPDYQVRLVRNDPATLRFRGLLHSSAEPALPARYLAAPIYHLALLGTTVEERDARVQRYEAVPFAVPNIDNAGFYLPELRQDAALEPVPEADRGLVEGALAGIDQVDGEPAPAQDVPLAEALHRSPIRELPGEAYEVELECLEHDLRFLAGSAHEVPVRIRNRGGESFPWGDWTPAVRPSYHWLTPAGEELVRDGHRTLLSHDLGPADEAIVPLVVVAPPEPGEYLLEIDLVHEGVRWFGCGLRVPATVEGPVDRLTAAPRDPRQGRVVCVLGMHRSGTSAVAQLLSLLGVFLGGSDELLSRRPTTARVSGSTATSSR